MVPKHNLFTGTVEVRIPSPEWTTKAATQYENGNPFHQVGCRPPNDLVLTELIAGHTPIPRFGDVTLPITALFLVYSKLVMNLRRFWESEFGFMTCTSNPSAFQNRR